MGASLPAIVIRKEKDLVRHFRAAGATSAANAKSAVALGVDQRLAWMILLKKDIILEAAPGTYYLDENAWEESRIRRRKIALVVLVVAAVAAFAAVFATMSAQR